MDDVVAITLFRHGLTEGNKRKEYLGWTDSPLTKEAVQKLQTYQLSKYDLFLSSNLGRCVQTMKVLFPDEEPVKLMEMREMNFGLFEGKTYEELKNNMMYQQWLDHPFTMAPPNGESFQLFQSRVEKGWKKIVELLLKDDKTRVFVVTHGGVIRYLLERFSHEEKGFWEWKIEHGNGYVLTFEKEQLRSGEPCISLQEVPLTGKRNG